MANSGEGRLSFRGTKVTAAAATVCLLAGCDSMRSAVHDPTGPDTSITSAQSSAASYDFNGDIQGKKGAIHEEGITSVENNGSGTIDLHVSSDDTQFHIIFSDITCLEDGSIKTDISSDDADAPANSESFTYPSTVAGQFESCDNNRHFVPRTTALTEQAGAFWLGIVATAFEQADN